ncbi:DUF6531 domain-containing protein [Myxococcus sp. XM-1-1-1]|uniref:RHS repeat-associated core domain-containing protein n=1 Tax=Myxococcus sp. XM-1-1-1 TaxID=2874602 RepID=UPI001CBFF557|nr:RHS repeat-associated core domain-containing protein [Myxococcus sp. XM-1-1-1]MBZ4407621.1 DUF6531 domain-containing protein [Myxococcus sp. XM-1-1-1]
MMPAAKHFDLLLGIDIHLVQPPGPVPPVPIPHPHLGLVFDPVDYVPVLGATVLVGGLPRAQAGSSGIALPPHIPLGGVFVKPPANESELFMGSSTVSVDGDAFSYLGLPVLSCQDIGIPPIPRLKKKKTTKSLVLPTTAVLSIPLPVLVGGAPTVSLMALAMRAGFALLGALLRKVKALRKTRKAQNGVHCTGGHPVDIITGANFDEFTDAVSPPPGLFRWRRHYTTARATEQGPLGWGFRHEYQHTLRLMRQAWRYENGQGRVIDFTPMGPGEVETLQQGVVLRRLDARRFEVCEADAPRFELELAGAEPLARLRFVRSPDAELELRYRGARLVLLIERTRHGRQRYACAYDARGRMTSLLRLRDGGPPECLASYGYDKRGRLVTSCDAEGGRHALVHDEAHRWTEMTTPGGYRFWWKYDDQGRCVETSGEDGLWWARFEYDAERRETRVTERQGGVSVFKYDANDTLLERVDPYGGVLRREVDADGGIVREVDSGGRVTRWLYDAQGAHTGLLDPFGQRLPPAETQADPPGPDLFSHPVTPLGHLLGLRMEELASAATRDLPTLLERVPAELSTVLATLVRAHPPAEEATAPVREYDRLGRCIKEVDAAGRVQAWSYDTGGNRVWHQDADGSITRWGIGRWNLVVSETDALGHTLHVAHSSTEEVVRVEDAGGAVSEYARDEKDRLVRVTRHGVARDEYVWDVGDRLVEKRDGHGRRLLRLDYEQEGHLVTCTLASGATHLLAFDLEDQVIRASTDAHTVALERDARGRMRSDLRDGLGVVHTVRGRERRTEVLGFTSTVVDEQGSLVQVVDPTGGAHAIWKHSAGWVLREHAQGTRELRQHDDRGWPLSTLRWRWTDDGQLQHHGVRYERTPEGDCIGVHDSVDGETLYTVDAAHRLVEEDGPGGRHLYHLDAAGNLLAKPGLRGVVLQEGNRLVEANGERFVYDDRNHIAERHREDGSRVRYTYDSADMLIRVEDGHAEPWTADYDAIGRRIRCGRGARQTWFYWDGERLAAEHASDGRLRIHVYGAHDALVPLLFVDYEHPEAHPSTGRVYTLFTSPNGTPTRIEDARGQPVWRATRIEPYGHVEVDAASTVDCPLRMVGHYHDAETGLFYNRFRYYEPRLGRYLQSDPLGTGGGSNLYAYAPHPLDQVDVLGLVHSKKGKASAKGGKSAKGVTRVETLLTLPIKSRIHKKKKLQAQKKIVYTDPQGRKSTYFLDGKGRTVLSEVPLDPPKKYKKEGVSHIKPDGYQSGIDHRGHLGPERGVANQDLVNVPENVIAEHGTKSNLSVKKRLENKSIATAKTTPNTLFVSEPKYSGSSGRPTEVAHSLLDGSGKPITGHSQVIPNPKT